MLRLIIVIIFIHCNLLPSHAVAQTRGCPEGNGINALNDISRLTNVPTKDRWNALKDSWSKYRKCDDGAIAEGYSDLIVTMLKQQWERLPDLIILADQSEEFAGFVINHIDELASPEDFQKIKSNLSHCPKGGKPLCKKITKRLKAVESLDELASPEDFQKIKSNLSHSPKGSTSLCTKSTKRLKAVESLK